MFSPSYLESGSGPVLVLLLAREFIVFRCGWSIWSSRRVFAVDCFFYRLSVSRRLIVSCRRRQCQLICQKTTTPRPSCKRGWTLQKGLEAEEHLKAHVVEHLVDVNHARLECIFDVMNRALMDKHRMARYLCSCLQHRAIRTSQKSALRGGSERESVVRERERGRESE